jgi:hypothetical protein
MPERSLHIADLGERGNLLAFAGAVLRLDEAAVIRLRRRTDDRVGAWAATGFDVLAGRAVAAELNPADATVAADVLVEQLRDTGPDVDLGYAMDSAWRGALPPEQGFVHVDDVPAERLVELAERGSALAQDRVPVSLLDQEVIEVSGGGERVGVAMRMVFALVAMGFVPDAPAEMVRVRAERNWIRLDARFGSVGRRRTAGPALLV